MYFHGEMSLSIHKSMSQSKLFVIDIPRPDGKARDNRWHVISISDSSWLGQDGGTESLTSFVDGGEVYTFRRAWKQQRLLRESGHNTVLLRADPYPLLPGKMTPLHLNQLGA